MEDMSYKIGGITGGCFPLGGYSGDSQYSGDVSGHTGDSQYSGDVSWLSGDNGI